MQCNPLVGVPQTDLRDWISCTTRATTGPTGGVTARQLFTEELSRRIPSKSDRFCELLKLTVVLSWRALSPGVCFAEKTCAALLGFVPNNPTKDGFAAAAPLDALLLRCNADNLATYGIPFVAVRFPAVNNI